jgi:hypothetical protein
MSLIIHKAHNLVVLVFKLSYNNIVVKKNLKIFLILVILVEMSFTPLFSSAEGIVPTEKSSSIGVDIIPSNPKPNEDVKITLSSYSFDIDKSYIEWESGGKILLSGYGKKVYSFTTGKISTNNLFNVSIKPNDSENIIKKTISVDISEIDLLWEATDSYVPPFYKGKAMLPQGGSIKVVAMPNINKQNLTYSWERPFESSKDQSGFGKKSISFQNKELTKLEEVSVVVESVDGTYKSENSIAIPTKPVDILFYKKSPTEGVLYNNAIVDTYTMYEDEMTIKSEPFFFSLNNGKDFLSYIWKVNGKSVETPNKKSEITIRPSSRGGEATVSVIIENTRTFLQKANNLIKLVL